MLAALFPFFGRLQLRLWPVVAPRRFEKRNAGSRFGICGKNGGMSKKNLAKKFPQLSRVSKLGDGLAGSGDARPEVMLAPCWHH